MSIESREAKVFAVLLVSMTAVAIVLMALGKNPPSAGAFCLDTYYGLDPVEEVISSRLAQSPDRWNSIEVCYSGTKAGNVELLASFAGLASAEDINCHFCLCNGIGGDDGQIQATEKWQRQSSIIPAQTWGGDPVSVSAPGDRKSIHWRLATHGGDRTIRICVVADGKTSLPTDFQAKRVEALVEQLCRKFDIQSEYICYPGDWQ